MHGFHAILPGQSRFRVGWERNVECDVLRLSTRRFNKPRVRQWCECEGDRGEITVEEREGNFQLRSQIRLPDVCSYVRQATRCCAALPMWRNSASESSVRYRSTSAECAGYRRISVPGAKNESSPGQLSETMVVPQAAASNRRTEGEKPAIAISRRVTFNVNLDEE